MTAVEERAPEPDDATPALTPEPAERTGNPLVDEVLDSLDRLDGRPVDEHVTVFEAAHEKLRRVLSEAADAPASSAENPAPRRDGA